MTVWQGIVLGLVQGITEFLPVSSDGHLVLTEKLLGVTTPGVFVEVALHVATLGAVLVMYGSRLFHVLRGAVRGQPDDLRLVGLLALATLPAAAVGLLAKPLVERTFDSLWFAGGGFIVTGLVLLSARGKGGDRSVPGAGAAVLIGVAQAFAILPGVSRSGSTVSAALLAGVRPAAAAEFSFLLAVPAIAGAAVLESGELMSSAGSVGVTPLVVSCVVAFFSGIWAIRFLIRMLERGRFYVFAPYCFVVGAVSLALALWRP